MSKELIEQLAKEHGAAEMQWKTPNDDGSMKTYAFTSLELEAFAKAYAQTQGQSIPDGWKLVPIEPTEMMTYACRYVLRGDRMGNIAAPIYKAMLDASPAAPIESGVKG